MRKTLSLCALMLLALATFMIGDGWTAFGAGATGERQLRMQASSNWRDGVFVNGIALHNPFLDAPERWLDGSEFAKPKMAPAAVQTDPQVFEQSTPLRITWFGHSITLIELGGRRFLTDPVWSQRVSPYTWLGPKRWYPPPIALEDLPPIDAVLISHDHYDHLDTQTIKALIGRVGLFVVPLGVGAHLEYWGVSPEQIIELDWWDEVEIAGVQLTATPARHASGRMLIDNDRTLWMGFALASGEHAVYFSGDTGLFPELKYIGDRLGPFDVTLIEVGAYGADWPDWHIGPEQAVLAHNWVRGDVLLPVHWGLFDLARHAWTEPVERTLAAAGDAGYKVITPRPGMPVEMASGIDPEKWWPDIHWQRAERDPIVATGDFDRSLR
jgi:L-ascorbate metabolism protein UlaG (beta-lactamase superfamily)